ncbi:MAG: hypothetical protein QXP34_02055 [Candidatus Aenigmatarchaeota archaeon]
MVLFGSKKETKVGKGEIPVEKVKNMLNRGFSEIEIIDQLRKEGYSPEEIDKALTQAINEVKLAKQSIEPMPQQFTSQQPLYQTASQPITSQQQPFQFQSQQPSQPQFSIQNQPSSTIETNLESNKEILENIDYVSLEEYINYIIRDRVSELNRRLMEVNLKFKELEEKILNIREEMERATKENKDDLSKILNEIRLNRDNINDLAIKIDTLSKTLKELLPSLVESVRLLGEIVQKLKV